MQRELYVSHPLARMEFQTDGVDLFVDSVGRLINASESDLLAMKKMLKHLLERVKIDEAQHTFIPIPIPVKKIVLNSSHRSTQFLLGDPFWSGQAFPQSL